MNTYALDFADDWAPIAVDERELEDYYASTAPAGSPPLAHVREHVIAALTRTKQPLLVSPSPAIDLHLLYTLDDFIELDRGGPKELAGTRYWTATEAVEHLASLRPIIRADAEVPEDLRARVDDQLLAACDAIASTGAPVRFCEVPFEMSLDDQLAALASAGIEVRPGTPRADLAYNYDEHEIAARPWECLYDVTEHSDHLVDLAVKRIETTDDRDAYAGVVKTFAALSRGTFPANEITGDVDFAAATAFVEFTLDGKRHRIETVVTGEWLDASVFAKLDALLRDRSYGWGFYGHAAGEGLLVLATDRAGYLRLRAAGAPFTRLGR